MSETRREVREMLDFLQASPTAFHAVREAERLLEGFTPLEENSRWALRPGGRYYVTRNRSSLIAFALPEELPDAGRPPFAIVASHSDSPMFKIKENAEISVQGHYTQLDVEKYGGMIFACWLDRPLSVAGRAVVRDGGVLATRLIDMRRDVCVIPNVAIHMNREMNNGTKYQPHVDLFPLWGTGEAGGSFREAGAAPEDLCGCDLFLYNRVEGRVWGEEGAFVSSARLDDLECAYCGLTAIRDSRPRGHVSVCAVFDNEEVGSTTKQGANSTFLSDVLRRIALALGADEEDWHAMLRASFMLSADNAHAVHPNHPELSDPVNRAFMNEGVVVKYNANQKYTTDAVSGAVFHEICRRAGVPVQHYANRSDMPGGGTLGNISGTHVSVNTVDIGLAQLAMHSCWETAGTRDVEYMQRAMRAFYETELICHGDGAYELR